MTLQLPHKNVGVNATGKVHPLAPHEKKALENIDDPEVAKQILAETIHASRRAQENIERIAMEFPIQPANLSNEVITVEEPGEPGEVLVLGEDGKPGWGEAEGGVFPRGVFEVFHFSLAQGAGVEENFLVPLTIPFTNWVAFAWNESAVGKTNQLPWATLRFATGGGAKLESRVEVGITVELWAAVYGNEALDRYVSPSPGPLVLKTTRSAAANENVTSHIALCLINGFGPTRGSGSSNATTAALTKPEISTPGISLVSDLVFSAILRESNALPTARSDQVIFEGTTLAAGATRFVGSQLHFASQAEREAAATYEMWWEFAAASAGRIFSSQLIDAT